MSRDPCNCIRYDARLFPSKKASVTIVDRGETPRLSCKNVGGTFRRNYSDIHSSGRFDDIIAVYLRKTANHEVRPEISSRSSYSYRTRCEKGEFSSQSFLRLTYATIPPYGLFNRYYECFTFQSLKREIERRIEVIPRIQYEPQLISDPRYILTPGGQAPPHYYRLKAVDDVKNLGKSLHIVASSCPTDLSFLSNMCLQSRKLQSTTVV